MKKEGGKEGRIQIHTDVAGKDSTERAKAALL